MYRIALLFLLLLSTPSFSQVKILPDACMLLTSAEINTLFGTIVKQQEMNAPNNTACTHRSDDNAVEAIIHYRSMKDPDAAATWLKQMTDSINLDIANAKPGIAFTAVTALEGASAANYMTGEDPLLGQIVRMQFIMDKFLITFDTKGIASKKVIENLPEVYRIIRRNSGLE